MKIGLIVPGGVDRSGTHRVIPHLLWLIERLARKHEVHVFALRQEPRPAVYPLLGATVHNIGSRPRRPRTLVSILTEHAHNRFDVLHAFWAAPQGVVAAVTGGVTGVPILLTLIGGDLVAVDDIGFGALHHSRGLLWLRAATRGAALVTVESAAMQQRARALGIATERIPHGLALDHWPPRAPRPQVASPAQLLHVGTLNLVKDPFTLLRAVAHLRERRPVELDLVGDDTLNGRVQQEAARLGLSNIVRFHGFVPQYELRAFYERADALVVSSRFEAGPVAALEAAISGVPVVGTAVGHLLEWAPKAARVVPPGQPQLLADQIDAVLRADAGRVEMALAAQQFALREDANLAAARYEQIYEMLSSTRRVPSARV